MTTSAQKKPNPFAAIKQSHEAGVTPEPVHTIESAQVHKSTEVAVVRKPSGQRLRTDLLKKFKMLSAETGKPQYQLLEEAMEQYLRSISPTT